MDLFLTDNLAEVVKSDNIQDVNDKVLRCRKIIIKPNTQQRKRLLSWFDIYREYYNKAVMLIRKQRFNNEHQTLSFITIRKLVKSKMTKRDKKRIIKSKIPIHTLDNAFRDVAKAYKTAFSQLKSKIVKYFRLRPKKAQASTSTLVIESSAFSKKYNTFAQNGMGKFIQTSHNISGINRDCRLKYDSRNGDIILFHPTEQNVKVCQDRKSWCSLDPGIRTFQTLYSPECKNDYGTTEPRKIRQLLNQIENRKEHQGEKWYKKYYTKRYNKIRNIRDELHWKTALQLVSSFDTILIGNMSTRSIVSKQNNLNSKVKTTAYMLSHCLFKERLRAKAEQYGAIVIEVDESYTSKACGKCFHLNRGLGANKTFICPRENCNFTMDRDLNGARNIALKHFQLFNIAK